MLFSTFELFDPALSTSGDFDGRWIEENVDLTKPPDFSSPADTMKMPTAGSYILAKNNKWAEFLGKGYALKERGIRVEVASTK